MLIRIALLAGITLAVAILGATIYAHAQAPTPQPLAQQSNPVQDAVAKQLGDLIIANAQCGQQTLALSGQLAQAKQELEQAHKELADLRGKQTTTTPAPKGKP